MEDKRPHPPLPLSAHSPISSSSSATRLSVALLDLTPHLSLIPLHFNLIFSFSLSPSVSFSQYVGDVLPLPHIHPPNPFSSSPIHQSRCLSGSAPIVWPSNPLYSEHYSLVPRGWQKTCYLYILLPIQQLISPPYSFFIPLLSFQISSWLSVLSSLHSSCRSSSAL